MKGFFIFFPSNAFLRLRRKKALLRVNDRGVVGKCVYFTSLMSCVRVRACSFIK